MTRGIHWRVGNGESVRVFGDKWMPRPWFFKHISSPSFHGDATVSQLILPSRAWDKVKVREWFLNFEVPDILRIPVGSRAWADVWVWHFDFGCILCEKWV